MARIWADRVRETTTTTGTGTLSLGGTPTGYQEFDTVMNTGDTCYYCIVFGADWEVGIGTFTSGSPDTLARTTVIASSTGSAVSFGAGTKDVFLDLPASQVEKSVLETIIVACSDETTNLTTGTAKVTFRMPYAFTLLDLRANVNTAPVGSTIIVDVNMAGTTLMSATKLSIDASELTSVTAAAPPVLTTTTLTDDALMTIDFDQVGSSTPGKGLKVHLIGYRT